MKKIFTDLLGVFGIIIFMMLLWSSSTTEKASILILIITMLFMIILNIYFLVKRESINIIERLIYICLFFITSSIVFAVLLIDDYGIGTGSLYIVASLLAISVIGFILHNQIFIKKYSINIQNIIMFSVSIVLTLIGLLSILVN